MGTLPSQEPPEIHLRSIGRRFFNRLKFDSSSSGCFNGLMSAWKWIHVALNFNVKNLRVFTCNWTRFEQCSVRIFEKRLRDMISVKGIVQFCSFPSVEKSNRKTIFTEQHLFLNHIRTFIFLFPWREYTNRISKRDHIAISWSSNFSELCRVPANQGGSVQVPERS
jgi:hypothetical protein